MQLCITVEFPDNAMPDEIGAALRNAADDADRLLCIRGEVPAMDENWTLGLYGCAQRADLFRPE